MVKFVAKGPVNSVTDLILDPFTGVAFSNQMPNGFTAVSGDVFNKVEGSGFTYTNGIPNPTGTISLIAVVVSGEPAFTLSEMSIDFATLVATADLSAALDLIFSGNDQIQLGGKPDEFSEPGDGVDRVVGRGGGDTLFGESGNDTLIGGKGGDTLIGGEDDDTLIGGGGRDTLVFNTGDGNDKIEGYQLGKDGLDLSGTTFAKGDLKDYEIGGKRHDSDDDGNYLTVDPTDSTGKTVLIDLGSGHDRIELEGISISSLRKDVKANPDHYDFF